jgi:hypothetical protein
VGCKRVIEQINVHGYFVTPCDYGTLNNDILLHQVILQNSKQELRKWITCINGSVLFWAKSMGIIGPEISSFTKFIVIIKTSFPSMSIDINRRGLFFSRWFMSLQYAKCGIPQCVIAAEIHNPSVQSIHWVVNFAPDPWLLNNSIQDLFAFEITA